MSNTTFKVSNISKPAPKWYRITKRVMYILTSGTVLSGTLTRVGVSEGDQLLIVGWLLTIGEVLGAMLANGQEYSDTQ